MNDFITTLLQTVLVAAVPVCAAFIGKGVKALGTYLGQKSENETAKKYLAAAADAVATAVTYTSQVYVDKLKENGQFTKENQQEALIIATERASKGPSDKGSTLGNPNIEPFSECEVDTKKIFSPNCWVYLNSHIRSVLFVQLPILPQKSP